MNGILLFSFLQGILAFFAPCAVALIPGRISRLLSENKVSLFWSAVLTMAGVATVYILGGLLLLVAASFVKAYTAYIVITLGIGLIIIGVLMLLEKNVSLPMHVSFGKRSGLPESYLFGIAFGVGAFGCLFPLFLVVLSAAVSAGAVGFSYVVAYVLGMFVCIGALYAGVAFARERTKELLFRFLPLVNRITAVVTILAGLYLIYYQVPLL